MATAGLKSTMPFNLSGTAPSLKAAGLCLAAAAAARTIGWSATHGVLRGVRKDTFGFKGTAKAKSLVPKTRSLLMGLVALAALHRSRSVGFAGS